MYPLPETNITPENGWLEDEFPFGMVFPDPIRIFVKRRDTDVQFVPSFWSFSGGFTPLQKL